MASKSKLIVRISAGAAVVFAALAVILLCMFLSWQKAINTEASPDGTQYDSDGFPEVDWDYWLDINADIIGWITIPNTSINYPIVQAHADNPDYYLSHDVYGNYNPYGAIYLDAECEEDGLESKNAVILGHHMNDGSMFAEIADYSNSSFASEHVEVLIQTPSSKTVYEVRFAQIVNGSTATKRTIFSSEEDYEAWYEESLLGAAMVLDYDTVPDQTVSLVTCSYNYSSNERTIVIISEKEID